MITEICLIVITSTLVVFSIFMIILSLQLTKVVKAVQLDIRKFTDEGCGLLAKMENFLQSDAHTVSQHTTELLNTLNSLSTGVNEKVNSLNFLFHPVDFISSQLRSSPEQGNSKPSAFPKILKWIASSVILFRTTKEFIKK